MTVIKQAGSAKKAMSFTDDFMQKELADRLKTSRQNISHMKNGRCKMQQDIAQQGLQNIDNNLFKLAISHEFTLVLPDVFDGKGVKQSSLAFAVNLEREMSEYGVLTEKLMRMLASNQKLKHREQARQILYELIDVLGWGYNLLGNTLLILPS